MPTPARHLRATIAAFTLTACEPAPPPGPSLEAPASSEPLEAPMRRDSQREPSADDGEPGHGAKIASIAMRTWVYQRPDDRATKLGYLRAGAVVERAATSAGTEGCKGGWYRVVPRGYVCVGQGASLEIDHPVVRAAGQGPRRGEVTPYRYVISRHPPPHLYFKLPSEREQHEAEGKRRGESVALFGADKSRHGDPDPIPEILAKGEPLPKPYGAERPLAYKAHRGRANEASAFGLIATFEWTGRRMGLTTELDLIPLDRTRIATSSEVHGIVLERAGVPAFVMQHGVKTFEVAPPEPPRDRTVAAYRSAWELTGRDDGGLVETTQGVWLPAASLRKAKLREDPAGFAREGRKWIDVSIKQQLLVAYEGLRPVYATLVSSGRGEMGDPETTQATARGTFMIHSKHIAGTMDGDETTEDAFDLRDVPYIQYFHEGYAIHGAYWHDDFGKVRSHGCINLPPAAAAWLFEWTEPQVPDGWHGAVNNNAGTLIYVHG